MTLTQKKSCLHRHVDWIVINSFDPLLRCGRRCRSRRIGIQIGLELVTLARHDHGNGLAKAADGVQFVEAKDFTGGSVAAPFRHEAKPSLRRSGKILSQVMDPRLFVDDLVVADVAVSFAGHVDLESLD